MGYFHVDLGDTTDSALKSAQTNLQLFKEGIPDDDQLKNQLYMYLLGFIEHNLESAIKRLEEERRSRGDP